MQIEYRKDLPQLLTHHNLIHLPVAEIGVGTGRFARELLEGGVEMIWLVDLWGHIPKGVQDLQESQEWHDNNYELTMKNIAPFLMQCAFIRMLSVDAAKMVPDSKFGCAYLDACHDYDSVKADLNAWYPKLVSGGIMAGHDYLNPDFGVTEAVTEFAKEHNLEVHLIKDSPDIGSSFWFKKQSDD